MNLNIATILLQFLSMLMSYEKVILLGVKKKKNERQEEKTIIIWISRGITHHFGVWAW